MRLLCSFTSAPINSAGASFRKPASKATLSIAQKKDGDAFIQIFTEKSKNGDKFKIRNNISKCMTRFISEGKLTIELVEPRVNLMISKGNPDEIKKLCSGLKLALKGESLLGKGLLSSADKKPVKIGRTLKISIASKKDYKTKLSREKGFPVELQEFQANGIGLRTIDTRLYKLKNLRILDLTRNDLSKIDPRLTKIRLEVLILADNKLTESSFPDNFEDSPLSQSLEKIDISTNNFKKIPKSISRCSILKVLQADNNELISVPSQLPKSLSILSLKKNKINFTSLPRSHFFEKLDLTENPFTMKPEHVIQMPNIRYLPKLQELASKAYLQMKFNFTSRIMSRYLCDYLNKAVFCPCSNPLWRRRHMFLAEYDLKKFSKNPIAPRGTDFIVPQLEFCCSSKCLERYKTELEYVPPPEEEPMQVEPAE